MALFQGPKGTRDFYPADMLRRRYIERAWRDTAIRHGFDEIDGPTFEHRELYEKKSGEGILGEMFGVFSGKDPEQVAAAGRGRAEFGLRPEFTPTLARMYAARASSLPRPTKWFWTQNCFRAERPQRGRLREFWQWNVDLVGLDIPEEKWNAANDAEVAEAKARMDAECIACCVDLLRSLGLQPEDVVIQMSDRGLVSGLLQQLGVAENNVAGALQTLDRVERMTPQEAQLACADLGFELDKFRQEAGRIGSLATRGARFVGTEAHHLDWTCLRLLRQELERHGLHQWCRFDLSIARGLAYYTGMVFEVHEASGAERAIAGGGRYDNLIETFGGPPTPAVGFGMGDVVLSLVLQDRGLMPEGRELLERLSAPPASLRPDVFIIPGGREEDGSAGAAAEALRPLVARLRRGDTNANIPPLHARHSYKSTRHVGKLLKEAAAAHARLAVILESGTHATIKDLDTGEASASPVEIDALPRTLAAMLGR